MSETQVIRVRYWAAARSAAGTAEDAVSVSGPVTLADLTSDVVRRHPASRFADVIAVCSVLVGDQPVGSRDPAVVVVPPGSTVEFLPPFAGG
ncbi:MoaD/ThiS family protein [Nocardioides bizhenqiangii]|uniref:MoaD/ThiS family protein n=1 Tax=Nocardioides bizhenqiangii TaxID=3095076 RepID=A0ABZ0ZNV8_9ACTN|nr:MULTISPECIES: MoaD/ThiS family protein [unclassified Nocardioides]MDZ5619994.1 MoaD/ThiS family protein [Nocardioides sp. HM23]WQQ26004.1 MoaD/ThiS family protein [Nocardioides sp. HM61]